MNKQKHTQLHNVRAADCPWCQLEEASKQLVQANSAIAEKEAAIEELKKDRDLALAETYRCGYEAALLGQEL